MQVVTRECLKGLSNGTREIIKVVNQISRETDYPKCKYCQEEGKVDCFIKELEEVIPGDYPIVDMVAIEGKLA